MRLAAAQRAQADHLSYIVINGIAQVATVIGFARAAYADQVARADGAPMPRVFVSALDGTGLDALRRVLAEAAAAVNPAATGASGRGDTEVPVYAA